MLSHLRKQATEMRKRYPSTQIPHPSQTLADTPPCVLLNLDPRFLLSCPSAFPPVPDDRHVVTEYPASLFPRLLRCLLLPSSYFASVLYRSNMSDLYPRQGKKSHNSRIGRQTKREREEFKQIGHVRRQKTVSGFREGPALSTAEAAVLATER